MIGITGSLLTEQSTGLLAQVFADEGAVLTPPSALERILYFAEYTLMLVTVSLILHYIFLKPFGKKAAPVSVLLTACFAGVAFGVFPVLSTFDQDASNTADLLSVTLLVAGAYLMFRGRKSLWDCVIVIIYSSWFDLFHALAVPYVGKNVITGYILRIILNAAVGLFVFVYSRSHEVSILPQVFYTVPKWIYSILLLFEVAVYSGEFIDNELFLKIINTVSVILTFAGILYLIFKIFLLNYRQNEMLRRLDEQKSYGDTVASGDTELRRFRHDYRNQMIVVNALLSAGRTDDAREHLNNMNAAIRGELTRIRTGNFIADAIINNKATAAAAENISFEFSGRFPEDGIRSDDMCTIIANLLDNAIEASRRAEGERQIMLIAGSEGSRFWFTLSNPMQAGETTDLSTTKSDRKNHGFGIRNVKRALKEYDGELVTEAKDGVFTAKVMLTLKVS